MAFKDKLNEIFDIDGSAPPKDVIELAPLDTFRNNIRSRLNGIKSSALCVPQDPQIAPPIQPQESAIDDGIIVERENEIGLNTLKGSIIKMGPKGVADVISKLSTEKKEVDKATGVATSEFDKFVGGLKQDACETLLGSSAVPSNPAIGASNAPEATPVEPKTPEQKLPDLVTNKL